MIRHAIRLSAVTLALMASTAAVRAEGPGILHATLAEANQKTAEVSTAELRRILADGGAILLDTRGRAEFDAGHIPGARNLDAPAAEQIEAVERLVNGNKAAALVLYCNGPYCQASRRLAEKLVGAGFTNVRRYQLGMPVWRALGGPTEVAIGGITRVLGADRTAVFIDARAAGEFAQGTLPGAKNAPLDDVASGKLKVPLPEDDFNRRIVLFGRDAAQARKLAEYLSTRPWHNVSYFGGAFDELAALKGN
jgi:rhodanese-related sulfurtransferase